MYAQTININDNQAYVLNIPRLKTSLTHALIIEVRLLTSESMVATSLTLGIYTLGVHLCAFCLVLTLQRLKKKAADECKPKLQKINEKLAEMGHV